MTQLSDIPFSTFMCTPATPNCAAILARRSHLLVGISPFNSRFSDDYVHRLLRWALQSFENVDVLLAGEEASLLLEAIGTPVGKAARKARKAIDRNRRSVHTALDSIATPQSRRVSVHTFSDHRHTATHQSLRSAIDSAYRFHEGFRSACLEMSRAAITGRAHGIGLKLLGVTDAMCEVAVRYVLAELPYFLSGASLIGVEETLLAYHRPWPLGREILAGEYPIRMSEEQGYLLISEGVPLAPRQSTRGDGDPSRTEMSTDAAA
jgi:cyclo(L-leucyl-L-leucyl) synthase